MRSPCGRSSPSCRRRSGALLAPPGRSPRGRRSPGARRAEARPGSRRRSGFTLLETSISLAVLGLLLASVFAITVETSNFLSDNEVDTVLQSEAHRSFERITDILRKSGRVELGGTEYPRVTNGGSTLEFLLLEDLDGNGYPFEATTSALEWSPIVYALKADADGNLEIFVGLDRVHFVGRFVRSIRFRTIREDSTLELKEIDILLEVTRRAKSGFDLTYDVRGGVHMRN